MKIRVYFDSLYEAAAALGCEEDFSDEGWSFLEDYLGGCYCSDECAIEVPSLRYDFDEYDDFEAYLSQHCTVTVPEKADLSALSDSDIADWLTENDYAAGVTDSGSVIVHECCSYPDQNDLVDFLTSCGH